MHRQSRPGRPPDNPPCFLDLTYLLPPRPVPAPTSNGELENKRNCPLQPNARMDVRKRTGPCCDSDLDMCCALSIRLPRPPAHTHPPYPHGAPVHQGGLMYLHHCHSFALACIRVGYKAMLGFKSSILGQSLPTTDPRRARPPGLQLVIGIKTYFPEHMTPACASPPQAPGICPQHSDLARPKQLVHTARQPTGPSGICGQGPDGKRTAGSTETG